MRTIVLGMPVLAAIVAAACVAPSPTARESTEQLGAGDDQGSSTTPAALHDRIDELDACESRLGSTLGTYPVQRIQGMTETEPVLYAFYNVDMEGLDNSFTARIAGVNDQCELPANAAIGTVRAVLEAEPGAVIDANDPRSRVHIFTDVCGLAPIRNESGWYEGWLVHDVRVPDVAPPMANGRARFGTITQADADFIAALGTGNNTFGEVFTVDGKPPSIGLADVPTPTVPGAMPMIGNTVSLPVSLGTWNSLQGEDAHAFAELTPFTNWTFPLYEIPVTGGFRASYENGRQYGPLGGIGPNADSRIPGSGPLGVIHNGAVAAKFAFGDAPFRPRDADRSPDRCGDVAAQAEGRLRFIPSGLAREIFIDAFMRPKSFMPELTEPARRLFEAYAVEVARVDANGDGIVSFAEADIDGESDGLSNTRLYIAPVAFNRVEVTREINDGLLAPRLAPTRRATVMRGEGSFISSVCDGPVAAR
jgi:hypothetical protein